MAVEMGVTWILEVESAGLVNELDKRERKMLRTAPSPMS